MSIDLEMIDRGSVKERRGKDRLELELGVDDDEVDAGRAHDDDDNKSPTSSHYSLDAGCICEENHHHLLNDESMVGKATRMDYLC